jgi:hypothetical protein
MTPIIHKKINTLALSGIILIIIVFSFGIASPIPVKAQALPANYTLLEPLPCITGVTNCAAGATSTPTINIQTYIVYIFKLMVALAVFAAVVMCIIGGFEYMLTDSVSKKLDAKGTIKNAILGLAGALLSWLILYTINPNLVNVSLVTVPKLNLTATTTNLSAPDINSSTDTKVAAMAAAGVAQDNALQAQVDTDQTNENNLFNQYNACTPPGSSACQALYDKYVAAHDKTGADMGVNATTYADNNYNVQVANEAKETTADQVQQDATNIKNEETNALADCANGDLACQQKVKTDASVALIYSQNQTNIVNFENENATKSSSDALTAAQTLELQIQQTTAAQVAQAQAAGNTTAAQKYQANGKTQVQAVQQWVSAHNNP